MNSKSDKIFVVLLVAFAGLSLLLPGCVQSQTTPTASPSASPSAGLKEANLLSFSSWDEVSDFLKEAQSSSYGGSGRDFGIMKTVAAPMAVAESADAAGAVSSDYSTTNVQVEGVDEADILKNDGKFLYIVTQGKIVIVEAFPAEGMKNVSEISEKGESVSNIFIDGDKLVVFGTKQIEPHPFETVVRSLIYPPRPYYYSEAFLKVYDVTDKTVPKLVKTVSVKGDYVTSRLIDGKVYALFSQPAYYDYPMPLYYVDGIEKTIAPSDVQYFDYPDYSYAFNVFVGLDLNDLNAEEKKEIILMGYSQTVFVSKENIFVTFPSYNSFTIPWSILEQTVYPLLSGEYLKKIQAIDASDLPTWRKERLKISEASAFIDSLNESERTRIYDELQKKLETASQPQYSETTVVHKISLDGFKAMAQGSVPGTVLNQFSMDESNGYFRIATTTSEQTPFWTGMMGSAVKMPAREQVQKNHVFVLDGSLNVVGRLADLAPGEKIYSARFMGDRLYLVTFKKTDPLFAIDLSNPANPQVLGQLKIPGYSDYLHPYDETHLIGLGKNAVEAKEGNFAWYQGLKLSLFDVADVSKPKELAVFEIGDRGSDSAALHDHKAFLFDKNKGLLVIPVLEAKIDPEKYPLGVEQSAYGDFVFQGAYVFNVGLEKGFELKGRVSHATAEELAKSGRYWYSDRDVQRTAFIDGTLYTVSERFVKANDLQTLVEKNTVEIAKEQVFAGETLRV
ncbi:MAG: beta-propeller domain-containing protein [Candidatus Micrarchaeota archaeon]